MVSEFFLNPTGLYALLALLPFILLYIIKPKPKKIIIPSLMFFIRDKDKSTVNSFLQKFFNDFLFFIQFLVITLLAVSVAKPFIEVPAITYSDSTVFVIDGSASMGAHEEGKTRFARALDYVQENVGGKNTLILAGERNQVIVEGASRGETLQAMRALHPREVPVMNYYDGIVLAENFATGDTPIVHFISDFTHDRTERDFLSARTYLRSKGIQTFFEDVSHDSAQNVGIIDVEVRDTEVRVLIKNYDTFERSFDVKYGDTTESVTIPEDDVISLSLPIIPGQSTVELLVEDDFTVDNKAYISTPEEGSIHIMYITNNPNRYLLAALEIMDAVTVDIQQPPTVTFSNPSIVILGDVDKNLLIPGDIARIRRMVTDEGMALIVLAQEQLSALSAEDLLPIHINRDTPYEGAKNIVHEQFDSHLTPADLQFGQAQKLYDVGRKEGSLLIARSEPENIPVIVLGTAGRGRVMYYGLVDEVADFKADLYYPVFWKRVLDTLIGGKTLNELNRQTGQLLSIGRSEQVLTPRGVRRGDTLSMDFVGFYHTGDAVIAANLISEHEQRLNKDRVQMERSGLNTLAETLGRETQEQDISNYLIIAGILLLFFELLYLKFRGDI
ncbi:MAG: BatA domain-containing protein [Candidatus Woesearchaeota archaeon]